jgi:hypothetical protein
LTPYSNKTSPSVAYQSLKGPLRFGKELSNFFLGGGGGGVFGENK